MKVASGSVDFALTSYYYPRIFNHLGQMDWVIEDAQHRKEYAGWILEALERGDYIGDVVRHCQAFEEAVMELDRGLDVNLEIDGLPLEQLEQIWRTPEQAREITSSR